MKLFARYTILNFRAMLAVFSVSAGTLFFTFRHILIAQVDEGLEMEQEKQVQYIRQYHRLPRPISTGDQKIFYLKVDRLESASNRTITQQGEDGVEDFRELSFPVSFEGNNYRFYVSAPLEQTAYLLRAMALVTLVTIAMMLLIIYGINRSLVRHLLKPFYSTLDAMGKYALTQRVSLHLPPTPTEEFTALNLALNEMAARGQKDYQAMRAFTAQAAHEIHTPIAIIRTKLESLMQLPDISEAQAQQIAGVDDSVERLTRLFKSLLLLTKIENGLFLMNEELSMDELAEDQREALKEVFAAKNITPTFDLLPSRVNCNRHLAEVLLFNLLNNAIRYNYTGGMVEVRVRQGSLMISNTSSLPALDAEAAFRPFYRHPDRQQDGNGLGLSIVKQICDANGFVIEYSFKEGVHRFLVLFS